MLDTTSGIDFDRVLGRATNIEKSGAGLAVAPRETGDVMDPPSGAARRARPMRTASANGTSTSALPMAATTASSVRPAARAISSGENTSVERLESMGDTSPSSHEAKALPRIAGRLSSASTHFSAVSG